MSTLISDLYPLYRAFRNLWNPHWELTFFHYFQAYNQLSKWVSLYITDTIEIVVVLF